MAMTYSSLAAAKGTSGAVATWIDYTKLDVPVIIDEAQTLIYSFLRTREMMADTSFTIQIGGSFNPLPPRFLDPIGRIYQTSINLPIRHKDSNFVQRQMNDTETSGTLGTNPFATTAGSNLVTVFLTGHGINQNSVFNTSGATAFNGATIAGTFPVAAIIDANNFTIDISVLGTTPNASGVGGGAAIIYLVDNLVPGQPSWFGIWNENVYFDCSFLQATICKLQYYQSLPLLAATTNESNFLTNRYPQLMRTACMAAGADFMKDDNEYQKTVQRLQAHIQRIQIESEMIYRGMELETETP